MIEIKLNYNRKYFEDFYFKGDNEKIFFSPITKEDTILSIVFGIICSALLMLAISTDKYWYAFFFFLLIFVVQCLNLRRKVVPILRWRKKVNLHLDSIAGYKNCRLLLSESTFSFIHDDKETIEHWSNFKKIDISEDGILLYGNDIYLIPQKSVAADDYLVLTKEVRNKINDMPG